MIIHYKGIKVSKKDFIEVIKRNSRAINICRGIANCSKHFVARENALDMKAESAWRATHATAGSLRASEPLVRYSSRLIVKEGGTERPASDIFEDAIKFWDKFLFDFGFTEGRLVEGTSQ